MTRLPLFRLRLTICLAGLAWFATRPAPRGCRLDAAAVEGGYRVNLPHATDGARFMVYLSSTDGRQAHTGITAHGWGSAPVLVQDPELARWDRVEFRRECRRWEWAWGLVSRWWNGVTK